MNESTLVPREEMSDLDWLARNVHVWPTNTPKAILPGDATFKLGAVFYGDCVAFSGELGPEYRRVNKADWLARRAELQNKPSWKDAPEWAEWLAQDPCGEWWFYDAKPCGDGGEWDSAVHSVSAEVVSDGAVLGSWRDTLEKRPEQSEFEPFVSVEDAKITIMQSDGDVKHFGGVIGRSITSKEDAATAKQPVPKGSGSPILGMVLTDLTNRALEGKEKYGEPLLAHNGRNPLWDAYQEALDLAMYLRQAIEEQK